MGKAAWGLAVWGLVLSSALTSTITKAALAERLDLQRLGEDILSENHSFSGRWLFRRRLLAGPCRGVYNYWVTLKGKISLIDFQLNAQGSVDAYADIRQLYARVDGGYAGKNRFCRRVKGWAGVLADRAQIRANVLVPNDDASLSTQMKVRVLMTKFGTIHMGRHVPGWFERSTTGVVNAGLGELWGSRLGNWVNEKLTRQLNKYLNAEGSGS